MLFRKAERVSTSDDTTIKFQNLSSLITSSHKNPKWEKTEQSDDPIFVSRMRNAEACITENHHELARVKNQKKASEKGQKWGFLGCFSLYLLLRDNSDFENVVVALVG